MVRLTVKVNKGLRRQHVADARWIVSLEAVSNSKEVQVSCISVAMAYVYSRGTYLLLALDSIRWVRQDCIVLGCYELVDDGKGENYLVLVITSKDGQIASGASSPITLSFPDVFLGLTDDTVPPGNGPHMFLSYIDEWELAFIAHRKNVDQHIVLFSWMLDDKNEAAMVEILDDSWRPRIFSQGNGDDNLIVGLGVEKVGPDEKAKLVLGDENKEVSPCCVLLCLTVDLKLSLFHFASATEASGPPEVDDSISDEEEDDHPVFSQGNGLLQFTSEEHKKGTNKAPFRLQSTEVKVDQLYGKGVDEISKGNSIMKPTAKSPGFEGSREQEVSVLNLNHDINERRPPSLGKKDGNSATSAVSQLLGPTVAIKDFSSLGNQGLADARPSADSFSRKLLTEVSKSTTAEALQKDFVALRGKLSTNGFGASSLSVTGGVVVSSVSSDVNSSILPNSGVQVNLFDTTASTVHTPVTQIQNLSYSIKASGSSIGRGGLTEAGINNLLPVVNKAKLPLHENVPMGKSTGYEPQDNQRTQTSKWQPNTDPKLSKQFSSVEEMAKELDALLQCIEGSGGFNDASITHQQPSVAALEEGIWTLSERCRMQLALMNQKIGEIQLLLDRTVQVLARTQYMEGIIKQATDDKYWDLWYQQKLSSELEMKHRYILEVNQNLTNQLIELERHLNALELKKFGNEDGIQKVYRHIPGQQGPSRHIQSLHSLHNTTRSQLAAAEQLSECLSKQMAVLSIDTPVHKQNVRQELFEAIGISYDGTSFNSPEKVTDEGTLSNEKLLVSSFSTAAKSYDTIDQSSVLKSSERETTRRRRDSLDLKLTHFEPPKTTVNRLRLRHELQASPGRFSLSTNKQHRNPALMDGSASSHDNKSNGSSTFFHPSKTKGSQAMDGYQLSKPLGISDSAPLLIAKQVATRDAQGLTSEGSRNHVTITQKSKILASNEPQSMEHSEVSVDQTPAFPTRLSARVHTSPKYAGKFSGSDDKEDITTKSTYGNGKKQSGRMEGSQLSTVYDISSAASFSGENFRSQASMSQLVAVMPSSMTSMSVPLTSSTGPSLEFGLSTPMHSSVVSPDNLSATAKAKTGAKKSLSPSESSSSSSSLFQSNDAAFQTSFTIPSSTNRLLKSQNKEVLKANDSYTLPASLPHSSLALDASSSPQSFPLPQPVPSSLDLAPPLRLGPSTGLSTSVEPTVPSGTSVRRSTPALDMSSKDHESEHTFDSPVLSSATALSSSSSVAIGKNDGSSDFTFVQEDEEDDMEEEAPEANELQFGNLGGFGIGSAAPNAAPTTKPPPFGFAFGGDTPTKSPSSPLSFTAPLGSGLFRPASFSFEHSPQQQSQQTNFDGSFATSFRSSEQTAGGTGFGQPSPIGSGQQALGSVLGAFGQSRQIGAAVGTGSATSSAFGGGGFSNPASSMPGGGFSSLASASGGGFSGLGTAGGGFAAAAAMPGGGFAAAATGGGFSAAAPGGFGAFSNQGGSGGFSAFSGSSGTGRPPSELFTQMRK